MCRGVEVGSPDLLVVVIALAGTKHADPLCNRLGRFMTGVNVSLDSTNGGRCEPFPHGRDSLGGEAATLIGYSEDPGEICHISDDRRLNVPDRTLLAALTDDPVAPVFARCAGAGGLLSVAGRELASRPRRLAPGELIERIVGQHGRHFIGIIHTEWM